MALPLRPRLIPPQCLTCLRTSTSAILRDLAAPISSPALRQQVRGKSKKRLPNNSRILPVRLIKDVPAYGRKGSIVPLPRGEMRNTWFPSRTAEYIPYRELTSLRKNNVPIERDFTFKTTRPEAEAATEDPGMTPSELRSASAFEKEAGVGRLTPQRSRELVDLFVPPRLEFYRQPIIEEVKDTPPPPQPQASEMQQFGGVAGDLFASRIRKEQPKPTSQPAQAIYGSVSAAQDVLTAIRAAMATNDEAARVVLQEGDVRFVDLGEREEDVEGGTRVKHVGEFVVEIKVRGADEGVRRVVKVIPQEM